jgi:hypothetical protein
MRTLLHKPISDLSADYRRRGSHACIAFTKSQEGAHPYAVSQIARHEEMYASANGEGRSFHLADFQKPAAMADHLCSDAKMAGI